MFIPISICRHWITHGSLMHDIIENCILVARNNDLTAFFKNCVRNDNHLEISFIYDSNLNYLIFVILFCGLVCFLLDMSIDKINKLNCNIVQF